MSVGYAPVGPTQPAPFDPNALTPEDQARLAAQMAQSAPPVLPAPAPVPAAGIAPPPPAPPATGLAGFNASDAAQSLAATHQPPLTVTASPPPAPATPTAAPAPPTETPKQTDELKAAQTDAEKARAENDKAQIEFQKAQEPYLKQRQDIADQQVRDQQASIRKDQEDQQHYAAARAAAEQQHQQTQDAIKKFKFRDYFSDGEGGTNWVRKIGAALAAAAGAYGAGLTHGPNYALQILNKDMDDAHAHQVGELDKLKDEEVMQRTGINDAELARQKARADLTFNDAARDKLIATQLDQIAARQKTAEFAPGLVKAAAQLHQDAAEKNAAGMKQLFEMNYKLQEEQRKKELDTATIAEKNAQAGLAIAKTGKVHAAGAGGGGGASVGANAEELARRIREGKDGKPLTDDQIIHAATELHIPLAGKAGVVTLDKVRSVAKFDADAAAKAARSGLQGERLDEGRFKDFEKEHGLPKLEFTQHKLSEVVAKIDKGNPIGAMSALMELDGAAKGGQATESSMHAITSHLGGAWEQLKGLLQKGENGNFSEGQRKLLKEAALDALAGNRETVDKIHSAFGHQFDYSKPGVKERAAGMFGPLGYRGAGAGGPPPAADPRIALAQKAVDSPTATPNQKANAAAFLRSVGR